MEFEIEGIFGSGETHRLLHQILEVETHQLVELRRIRRLLQKQHQAHFAKLYFFDSKGNTLMPVSLAVGKTATAVLEEFVSQGGEQVPDVGPVSFTTSDPTIATVDAASGLITAVAAGTATIAGLDAGNNLTASDTVTVTAVATFASLVITPN